MKAPPLQSAAIEANALTKVYGHGRTEVTALRGVDLRVEHGEVVALLGPSGAGKSTLLTAIGLINPPTSGRISIDGTPVLDGPRALVDLRAFRRQHLGFVFQKANLIPFLSALQNVEVALAINDVPSGPARHRALELLDYLGVADRAGNLPDALSGGEQQRVAIARALANRPSLLLADCSRTNQRPRLTATAAGRSWNCFARSPTSRAPAFSSSRTTTAPSTFLTAAWKWRMECWSQATPSPRQPEPILPPDHELLG
jgi:putative ABC transport system ATP-binding protein